MVASVSALSSAGQAASYYEADDYYSEGGLSPSEWQGAGAEELGLSGDVDRDQFRKLLDGEVAGRDLERAQVGFDHGRSGGRPPFDRRASRGCENGDGPC